VLPSGGYHSALTHFQFPSILRRAVLGMANQCMRERMEMQSIMGGWRFWLIGLHVTRALRGAGSEDAGMALVGPGISWPGWSSITAKPIHGKNRLQRAAGSQRLWHKLVPSAARALVTVQADEARTSNHHDTLHFHPLSHALVRHPQHGAPG